MSPISPASLSLPLSVANGGTGSATAAAALTALGAQAKLRYAAKSGDTTRVTTTDFADDPDLIILAVQPGVYHGKLICPVEMESVTPRFKGKMAFTGTRSIQGGFVYSAARGPSGGGSPTSLSSYSASDYVWGGANFVDGAADGIFKSEFLFTVTVAGDLSFQWAQIVSSADDVTAKAGSFLIITPLA